LHLPPSFFLLIENVLAFLCALLSIICIRPIFFSLFVALAYIDRRFTTATTITAPIPSPWSDPSFLRSLQHIFKKENLDEKHRHCSHSSLTQPFFLFISFILFI
jgi:hypothetical protein